MNPNLIELCPRVTPGGFVLAMIAWGVIVLMFFFFNSYFAADERAQRRYNRRKARIAEAYIDSGMEPFAARRQAEADLTALAKEQEAVVRKVLEEQR